MNCQPNCGACCFVISISSPIPGMPDGKPAGTTCIHLTSDLKCAIFDSPDRPDVCKNFHAERQLCGHSQTDAINNLADLEGINPENYKNVWPLI